MPKHTITKDDKVYATVYHRNKSIQEITESLDKLWEYYQQHKEELLNDYNNQTGTNE